MACKRVTAYIPDNPDLYDNLTGIQYLNFIADVFDISPAEREAGIRKYADLFEITEALGDLIGSYSIQNYAPALRLLSVKTSNATPATIDYASASNRSVAELRAIKTDQDDTKTRYPEYTKSYGGLRYADVYFGAAIENSKYYIGIADIARPNDVTGKNAAMTASSGPMALIDNDGYWNIAYKFGSPVGEEVGSENVHRVYYVPESMAYSSGKTCYKISLVGVE